MKSQSFFNILFNQTSFKEPFSLLSNIASITLQIYSLNQIYSTNSMSIKSISFIFIILSFIMQIHALMNFPYNQRLCLQELNKVLTNVNGTLASGQGFMNDCRYSHVFPGIRNGIVLSAQCPDENGDFQTSTQFFQIPPGPCKYNN